MEQITALQEAKIITVAGQFKLGVLTTDELVRVHSISQGIDLGNESAIGAYGSTTHLTSRSNAEIDVFLAGIPTAALADNLSTIVGEIHRADPKLVKKKSGFIQRFTGADIEFAVVYKSARKNVDRLLADSVSISNQLGRSLEMIRAIIDDFKAEIAEIRLYIAAGHLFLQTDTSSYAPQTHDLVQEGPRERLTRRLTNLALSLSAKELSIKQLELTAANFCSLADRHSEVKDVLIPIWQDHCSGMAIATSDLQKGIDVAHSSHGRLLSTLEKCAK